MQKFHRRTIYQALGRDPIHPFPARMAPGIALQVMSITDGPLRVLDPMMGSGTVLAMARSLGHRAIGYDVDPLAVLLSRVWTTAIDVKDVREAAERTLRTAQSTFRSLTQGDAYPQHCDEPSREFLRYWFDPYVRRQLTALSLAIAEESCAITRDTLWCSFSRLIITKQSGASLALDLSHSRPHRAFSVAPEKPFNRFLPAVDRVLENVIDVRDPERGPHPTINIGDARRLPVPSRSIDLVLTSPPYLNAIDYIRCSKFSLVWMGHRVDELRDVRAASIGTEVGSDASMRDPDVQHVMKALRVHKTMSQRHQRILGRYIHDMHTAIKQVARVLTDSGTAVYVVGENTLRGTYIRTSSIVSNLATLVGFTLKQRSVRTLPENRRYLPPPVALKRKAKFNLRMRREIVLTFTR
jgi:DNA modification methylase